MTRTAAALRRDRELANARQAAYKARKTGVAVDQLACTCWCETVILHIPRQDVLDGRTESCGRHACRDTAA